MKHAIIPKTYMVKKNIVVTETPQGDINVAFEGMFKVWSVKNARDYNGLLYEIMKKNTAMYEDAKYTKEIVAAVKTAIIDSMVEYNEVVRAEAE